MLLKTWITNSLVHTDDWYNGRLAKLTASEWYRFMQEKPYTTGAMSYLYEKAGEESTGIPCRDSITTEATEWGHEYEPENLRMFMNTMGVEFLVTQKLIAEPGGRCGCTPDGLIVVRESSDQLSYQVETVEAKCPPSYAQYCKLALCKNVQELKIVSPIYFWQCMKQLDQCGALRGFLSIYHPKFRYGGLKIFEFRKTHLIPEFKLLAERKKMAIDKFNEIRGQLLNLVPFQSSEIIAA